MGSSGDAAIDFVEIARLLFVEALGGAALGLVTGYIAFLAMRSIDNYPIEVLISLGLVTGTYAVAQSLGVSGPIAVVVAGTGNSAAMHAMSGEMRRYLFDFWSLIDEILNSVLFLLIGLEVLVIRFDIFLLPLAMAAISVVFIARLISVTLPMAFVSLKQRFVKRTIPILTWGGVRGGISVTLACPSPWWTSGRILAATYLVVLFTLIVQGLTLPAVVKRFANPASAPAD